MPPVIQCTPTRPGCACVKMTTLCPRARSRVAKAYMCSSTPPTDGRKKSLKSNTTCRSGHASSFGADDDGDDDDGAHGARTDASPARVAPRVATRAMIAMANGASVTVWWMDGLCSRARKSLKRNRRVLLININMRLLYTSSDSESEFGVFPRRPAVRARENVPRESAFEPNVNGGAMRTSDILQRFVDENDWNGKPKHGSPLVVIER